VRTCTEQEELFERFMLSQVVPVGVIATSNKSGLQPGGHSVHYKIQLPCIVNVQANW
jgi:hypothetical protein